MDHYTVAEGDSLSSIAAEHGTDWQHVYAANQDAVGANPDVIQPGTTLTIPGHDLSQDGSQDTSGIDLAHPEPHAGQQPGETPAPAPEPGPHDEHPADAGHDDPHEIGFEHEPAPENTDHPDIDHDADHSDDGWS
ncbi:MAG: LysM peptidoglycan-binding domain-containing protein [Mycobacteriaceae bacterium]|nr:LysM peptidoglycan-binding domain-containing protein [Mycobacteriaceae bacterium]